MNLASTSIMCLALTFGSGGRFEGALMGLNGFASILPAAYWLHKIVFLDKQVYVRAITTFGILTLIGFASMIVLLARNEQQFGMGLTNDFALLDHPASMAKAVIALSMLTTLFSVTGFLVAYMGWMSEHSPVRRHPSVTEGSATRLRNSGSSHATNASESTLVAHVDLDSHKVQGLSIAMKEVSSTHV
ncbi:hypothetical protein P691DRAFT_756531 [Macrolepiota fuliginosa MF-IS2]|uniref:Uncharacterized protein n=1 Tax=Macrolepiota fuliginosa MF-IS2 TaxID=1400762 RepID=A0A9P6C7T4_9AGAR|nr:hypothetical protein P691DRAFT_756531 [Macrolepiota fuliginosa MF-IS2]